MRGRVIVPHLTYSRFENTSSLNDGIERLTRAIQAVEAGNSSPEMKAATVTSLDYRRIEMEYVKTLAQLDDELKHGHARQSVGMLAEKGRRLNRELYGEPDDRIVEMARGEVWANINQKPYRRVCKRLLMNSSLSMALSSQRLQAFVCHVYTICRRSIGRGSMSSKKMPI